MTEFIEGRVYFIAHPQEMMYRMFGVKRGYTCSDCGFLIEGNCKAYYQQPARIKDPKGSACDAFRIRGTEIIEISD